MADGVCSDEDDFSAHGGCAPGLCDNDPCRGGISDRSGGDDEIGAAEGAVREKDAKRGRREVAVQGSLILAASDGGSDTRPAGVDDDVDDGRSVHGGLRKKEKAEGEGMKEEVVSPTTTTAAAATLLVSFSFNFYFLFLFLFFWNWILCLALDLGIETFCYGLLMMMVFDLICDFMVMAIVLAG